MPKISEFFGISIYMYNREHGPPHFRARYGGEEALIGIEDLSVLQGELSPRARGLMAEWASRHQEELLQNWQRARDHEPLAQIEPLALGTRIAVKKIVEAEAREDYRLWVRYEDGAEGEVDLSNLVGKGVFERCWDPAEFQKVSIDPDTDTVAWPGGIDLCPDSLYDDLVGAPLA